MVLRIRLNADDLGRVRFASVPAPVLETVLMLFEMRNRPRSPTGHRGDWRRRVRADFPAQARPLLNLVPTSSYAIYLDVLTADPEQAFHRVAEAPGRIHEHSLARITDGLDRIHRYRLAAPPSAVPAPTPAPAAGTPAWLRRYADGDPGLLRSLDRALRAFYEVCLTPDWSSATARFHEAVDRHSATQRDRGTAAMLNSLHPDLRWNGSVLQSPYPWDRDVYPQGNGLILMPSAFWSGSPLITWDPLAPAQHVLIYPAVSGGREPGGRSSDLAAALGALLGPTRATVLTTLRRPQTTGGIARELGISTSAVSDHTATLREAGLITSRREGQRVEHRLTRLGQALITQPR